MAGEILFPWVLTGFLVMDSVMYSHPLYSKFFFELYFVLAKIQVTTDVMEIKLSDLPIWFHIYALLMQGSFTGPRIFWSGSSLRTEATGYGLVINISSLILCEKVPILLQNWFILSFITSSSVFFAEWIGISQIPVPLQVFFAQLMLADMNKELKGLRFLT